MARVKTSESARRDAIVTPRAGLRLTRDEVVADYRLAFRSRIASVLGRREVLMGKAPFGIFGDGKEIAQIALAKAFRPGDWRAGYYRDQTFAFATGLATFPQFFAQLYADADVSREPFSGGRQMVSHFASRSLDEQGRWRRIVDMPNSGSDLSAVSAQLPRAVGLAYASKLYRQNPHLRAIAEGFSRGGDEVTFATVGNGGVAEGIFWETLNAAGVLQVPLAISVWDDEFGISVPNDRQVTKASISAAIAGFEPDARPGIDVYVEKGWDYVALCDAYAQGIEKVRRDHTPALFHIIEMTQPQGHSTSGSHERYKSRERLRFETEGDPISRMRDWMVAEGLVTAEQLDGYEADDRIWVEAARSRAYADYQAPLVAERAQLLALLDAADAPELSALRDELREGEATRRGVQATARRALHLLRARSDADRAPMDRFVADYAAQADLHYNSHLLSSSADSPLRTPEVAAVYSKGSETVDGRVLLLRCFERNFARDARIFVVGEDIGALGDVNLAFEGMAETFGPLRVTDTGIRETTILGQGIGAALRGLRPLVDIQYIDYMLYALQTASDDLATLRFRTAGGQHAPVVIRTKGHRLQGIWHTGSPMGLLLHALRGVHLCVPRNMTQAAGFYNTLLRGDDPGIVVEVLNGYRLKERVPDNVGEFTIALGVPEVLREGSDVTLVTYGALCRIAMDAATHLASLGVSVEVIDVRTLAPFDVRQRIAESVRKTGALLVVDEDVPGAGSAYMLFNIIEKQDVYDYLDVAPRTLSARDNRVAVGQDADYFGKPNREDIIEAAYALTRERRPRDLPPLRG